MPDTSDPTTVPGARSDSRRRRTRRSARSCRRARSRGRRPRRPSLTLAAPDNPVKWPIADDNKPIADGLAPEKGATLKIYNYADYLSPQAIKSFEDKYDDEDRDLDLQRRRRGDHQAAQWSRLRHLQRQLHRDQPAGERRTASAAEPLLHPRHQERLAELHQPLVRPGMAIHRAVHHLHHRNRLADRSGARRYRRAEESVRRRSGIRRTRARPPSSTTCTPRWPWCFCAKALRTSTPPRRPT